MRYTPQLRDLRWLVEKPIAHRGLHDEAKGLVENCESAFADAILRGFAIECDLQLTADSQAVVFHDDEVDRLLGGEGPVRNFSAAEIRRMHYRQGKDRIQTLPELLEQVAGRTTLVIEIKSLWDKSYALTDHVLDVIESYKGPVALMSFDPDVVARIAVVSPHTVRGITADRVIDSYYNPLAVSQRLAMQNLWHLPESRPHFVSFDFHQLPYQPVTEIRASGHPVISWTIRSGADAALARRWSDQITFEGFIPECH